MALVVLYLLNANRLDRRQYEEAVDRSEARAEAAELRTDAVREAAEQARRDRYACEERLMEIRAELAQLRHRGGAA